jgi:hypothetical protein
MRNKKRATVYVVYVTEEGQKFLENQSKKEGLYDENLLEQYLICGIRDDDSWTGNMNIEVTKVHGGSVLPYVN